MKATGIVKRVDDLGRIALPKEVRRKIGISEGSAMEIFLSGNEIVLKNYSPEDELECMASNLMEAVEDMCVDIGPEKTGDIRRHIREVQRLLRRGN